MSHLLPTYQRIPLKFTHGKGVWLFDEDNNKYLDTTSGLGVNILGHGRSDISRVLAEQALKYIHVSNCFEIPEQETLAKVLCRFSHMEKAFFCNTGSEANETALKLVRLFGKQKGIEAPKVIVMEKAFHGRTLATLSASSNRIVQAGFEPLVSGFLRVPLNDLKAIEQLAHSCQDIVAILLEPILGSGGVHVAQNDYLQGLRAICDQNDWLLVMDEVQSGMGRSGQFLAHHFSGVQADIVALAKGLGNGLPIGACLTRQRCNDLFKVGQHGSTFGGNPLCCHTALKVLSLIDEEHLVDNARLQGEFILKALKEQLGAHPHVREIRGQGLMIGIELDTPCGAIVNQALPFKLLLNVTQGNVIRLLPSLILSQQEATWICETLPKVIDNFYA